MGFKTPITIKEAIGKIESNQYVLPAIQREFVWKADQIERLFDSLMRGYPIGSFLFWQVQAKHVNDFQFYRFMDRYHERDIRHNEPFVPIPGRDITAVLDGQQRLTALNIGLRGWYAYKLPRYWWRYDRAFPKRELYINLRAMPERPNTTENAFDIRFLRQSDLNAAADDVHWFKIGNILTFPNIQSVFQYCVKNGLVNDQNTYPSDTLMQLWSVINQESFVNYYEEDEQDLDKVLNVFIRVNSGGTPLSYSDMLLSIATAQWQEKDARQEIYGLVDRLNDIGHGFTFNKDYVLKGSLLLTDVPNVQFRVNNFNKQNMATIEDNWDQLARSLQLTVQLLASWGYTTQTLPSAYATLPLAYYLYQINNPHNFVTAKHHVDSRQRMQHWLRIALLKRTLSGTPDNILRIIRAAMQQADTRSAFPGEAIFAALATTTRSMNVDQDELEGLLSYRYDQSYTFSLLTMLYPWLKYDQQFHVDHIFPRAMFKKRQLQQRGIPENDWPLWLEQYNNLGNLQLLQGPVNMSKSDQEFESWLQGECEEPASLGEYKTHHYIPEVDLAFENFPHFVEERTALIRTKLAELLNVTLTTG